MEETTKFVKRLPDDARIQIQINDKELEIYSQAEISGEMVSLSDAYHDLQAIKLVIDQMLQQINYEDGGFPPSSYLDITISANGDEKGNKISGSLIKDRENFLDFFDALVNEFEYQEEVDIKTMKNNG